MFDLIIKNGKIIDGTGNVPYFADLGIKDGKISKIAKELSGGEVIDASRLCVTPGFIDSHSHSDTDFLSFPEQKEKIEQGITVSVGGQCGGSKYPFIDENGVHKTVGDFFDVCSNMTFGSHLTMLCGHCNIRRMVMGIEDRYATAEEIEKMKELLRENIRCGAQGISFGLIYTPSCSASTEELIALAKVAAEEGAIVTAHIRNEGDTLIEACEEFINVIKQSGATGVLSHHKAMGEKNHGKVLKTLEMIDAANEEGADIYMDVYPYTASHTGLAARFVPKEYRAIGVRKALTDPKMREEIYKWDLKTYGDKLDWVLITSCPAYPQYEGLRLPEAAALHKKTSYETVYDMLIESDGAGYGCYFMADEDDLKRVLAHPRCMVGTDGEVAADRAVFHPRIRGTFPRVLGKYIREEKVLPLVDIIRKITSLPARIYGIKNKGLLLEGFDADICIFDEEKIIDKATYTDFRAKCEGLEYVISGGAVAARDGVFTGEKRANVLLRNK